MPCSFCKGPHTIKKCDSAILARCNAEFAAACAVGCIRARNLIVKYTLEKTRAMAVMRGFKTKGVSVNTIKRMSVEFLLDSAFPDWRPIINDYIAIENDALMVDSRLRDAELKEMWNEVREKNKQIENMINSFVTKTTAKIPAKAVHDCAVCLENVAQRNFVVFNCNHELCVPCVSGLYMSSKRTCPMCRANLTHITANSVATETRMKKVFTKITDKNRNFVL